jgi:hypothetical protein
MFDQLWTDVVTVYKTLGKPGNLVLMAVPDGVSYKVELAYSYHGYTVLAKGNSATAVLQSYLKSLKDEAQQKVIQLQAEAIESQEKAKQLSQICA